MEISDNIKQKNEHQKVLIIYACLIVNYNLTMFTA